MNKVVVTGLVAASLWTAAYIGRPAAVAEASSSAQYRDGRPTAKFRLYSVTASPGQIIKQGDEYRMFFSAAVDHPTRRTLSIARTKSLGGPWTPDPEPILPASEQVENSSLYFEAANKTWFLFTNHVGIDRFEYTDAVWVYWSKDLDRWNPDHKAVVLDRNNCSWSRHIVGLPSVVRYGDRLALFYDGNAAAKMPHGVKSHMDRDIGLAWLRLPLTPPVPNR